MALTVGPWDVALVVVVSLQATVLAYLARPEWKAIVLSLPFPFTVATLALGRPTDITNILALVLLFLYTQGVRVLHERARVRIVPAIVVAAVSYASVASLLAPRLPHDAITFWVAGAAVFLLSAALLRALPGRREPAYRSSLPVWLKLPIIVLVVTGLVILKSYLQGFMTLFPMVGVVAAYEARHSLWTMSRQIPVLMLAMVPFIAVSRVATPSIGLGLSLAAGWAVYLVVFLPVAWWMRPRAPGPQ